MSWLHRMFKLPFRLAVAIAIFGSGLPQGLQGRVAISGADSGVFAPLELRPNDDLDMVVIPAGSFTMGSGKNNDEKPPHTVYIRSFLIGKTEVTQKQWLEVMGSNPSRFPLCGPECPVENVSWNDVEEFIAVINHKTGQKYRLPSEAEWEYAARAGTITEWSFGDDQSKVGNYAWHDRNSGGKTHAVAQRLPNAFGLFDMQGNVWEWTQDCWHENYIGAPAEDSAWATGCSSNSRVLRGGSWSNNPAYLRSANRDRSNPGYRSTDSGFRLARTP